MGGTWKTVIGIVTIAITLIVFPIVLEGVATVLADANLANYTGLEAVVGVTPLLIWVAMLFTGGLLTFQGVRSGRKGKGSSKRFR